MHINNSLLKRIDSFKWFSKCGIRLGRNTDFETISLRNWDEAVESCLGGGWQETLLKASGILNSALSSRTDEWQEVFFKAKDFYEGGALPEVQCFCYENSINYGITSTIYKIVINAIIEDTFKNSLNSPPFFLRLLRVLELGRFPCGWEGEWPEGKLVFF